MKTLLFLSKWLIFVLFMFLSVIQTMQAQFITLNNRQFVKGNQDFYPIVCNYSFEIVFNEIDSFNYYVSRICGYGKGMPGSYEPLPNYEYECTNNVSAYYEILADFYKIKSMGFNCIRTHNIGVYKDDPSKTGIIGFKHLCLKNKIPIDQAYHCCKRYENILPPYNTNSFIQNTLFPSIQNILNAAGEAGLKVILDCGYGDISHHDVDASDYADYLSVLANRFKNDTNLLAYVYIEEPSYSHQQGLNKEKVCQYTQMWYDALKASDTNHLITAGGCADFADIDSWDPTFMKLDFYSPHFYPHTLSYEYENGLPYSPTEALNRIKGEMLWLHRNCPVPWIVGETGFSATDDFYRPYLGDYSWTPKTVTPPDVDGNLSQQAAYATNTLNFVRDIGGSGYSWWNYQENWWNPRDDGMGLLRHGNLTDSNINKPVVNSFINYPNPPPTPQPYQYPGNYFDPYNFSVYSPPLNGRQILKGRITEACGSTPIGIPNGLKDVWVGVWLKYQVDDSTFITTINYTFTNDSGYLLKYPNYPTSISALKIMSAGNEYYKWYNNENDIFLNSHFDSFLNCIIVNDSLSTISYKYDNEVNNETVHPNANRNFMGWNTLTVQNVKVLNQAISEFKARNCVSINGNFTAELGSDVTIYCTNTFPECVGINKILPVENTAAQSMNNRIINDEKQIEVNFEPLKPYTFLDVFPNPSNGCFTVNLRTNKENQGIWFIEVYNTLGVKVYKTQTQNASLELDLSKFAKGIYYLKVQQNNNIFNQDLIIK